MHTREDKRCPVLVLHTRPRDDHHQQQAEGTADVTVHSVAITCLAAGLVWGGFAVCG